MTRAFDFARNAASPVARTSSSSRMSGSTEVAMAKPEPRAHARRVGLERRIDELAELGVLDDRRQQPAGDLVVEAQERAAEQDVVDGRVSSWSKPAPRVSRPETWPRTSTDALGRPDDPGQDLEQGALAGAVGADDRERLAVDAAASRRGAAPRTRCWLAAAEHLADGSTDRRLPGEPQVVLDAEVLDPDRVVRVGGSKDGRRPSLVGALTGPSRSWARGA